MTTDELSNLTGNIRCIRLRTHPELVTRNQKHQKCSHLHIKIFKTTTTCITEVSKDLEDSQIDISDIENKETYQKNIEKWKMSEIEKRRKIRTKWTKERKRSAEGRFGEKCLRKQKRTTSITKKPNFLHQGPVVGLGLSKKII